MAVRQDYIDIMVNIPGFSVRRVSIHNHEDDLDLMIELARKESKYRCRCGNEFTSYYDCDERFVRDLSYGVFKRSYLIFYQVRVDCPDCGVVTESLDWTLPRVEYSKRLAASVALACQEIRSIKAVAKQYGLHEKTVKAIDKAALEERLPDPSEAAPTVIGVDEFSIRRRHRYATTVIDFKSKEIPYIGLDRTKESLAGFYDALGPGKCENIEAVAMDMWKPYEEATREYCPNAAIVYDPFHVIAAYGREVVDRVRVQEFRKARGERKEAIKGSRYLLLKNASNLDVGRGEHVRLADLLRLNRRLLKVYILKDDLKQVWKYRSEAWSRKWIMDWYRRAVRSRIEPLKRFAKKLKGHMPGLLSHCRYPIHTSFIEGVNNKIKVIKRIAFGFRDMEYFFLKIRGAFGAKATHS